jgi:PKD repeat protein
MSTRTLILLSCAVGMSLLVLVLASCALFNKFPSAGFTIGPSTTGPAPFAVTLSGAPSSDPDGEIKTYSWDFGDGAQGTGKSVAHTYTAVGTYTIILTVTDNWDATDEAAKTVYVTAAELAGPMARLNASPTSGTSPLTVSFDASGSTYEGGTISAYEWAFGDGSTWTGRTAQHTYFSSGNQTFTVTLTVRGSDGKSGTATTSIRVTAPGGGGTPTGNDPSARFTVDESIGVAPFRVHFDPSESEAAEGRTILLYTWSFGDSDASSDVNPGVQEHVYATDSSSKTFSVTLLVLDNEGDSDSITKTVKVYNHRPVAGFDIANPPGGDQDDAGVVEYTTALAAFTADRWVEDDVVYGDILNKDPALVGTTFPVTITVCIRSRALEAAWYALTNTGNQATLTMANGTLATSSSVPSAPKDSAGDAYDAHNFSYDPEGQEWVAAPPAWFTAPTDYDQAWGIRYLRINWGDGSGEEQVDYAAAGAGGLGGNAIVTHDYTVNETTVRTITVTAVDWLGQKSAEFSRRVTLKEGYEVSADEI